MRAKKVEHFEEVETKKRSRSLVPKHGKLIEKVEILFNKKLHDAVEHHEEKVRETRYRKDGERTATIQEVVKEVIIEKPTIQIEYVDRVVTHEKEVEVPGPI